MELGGYMTCGVFASILSSFVLFCPLSCPLFCPLSCPFALVFAFLFTSLLLLSLFVLLSSACPLSLCGLLFLFPLRYMRKKRGRSVFGASSLVLLWVCLDVIKHYRYFLRFIVPVSIPFANDSCDRFRRFRWVDYGLPVVVNC